MHRRTAWVLIAVGALLLLIPAIVPPLVMASMMVTMPAMQAPETPPVEMPMGGMPIGGMPMAGMTGTFLLMWIVPILGIGLIVAGVVAFLRPSLARPDQPLSGGEHPIVILQRRYAGGEIGREDYERIRGDLSRAG